MLRPGQRSLVERHTVEALPGHLRDRSDKQEMGGAEKKAEEGASVQIWRREDGPVPASHTAESSLGTPGHPVS
jgi:hypothetical protein